MAFSAKATNCVRSVVKLSDEEVTEILARSDALQEADKTLSADAATVLAVQQILDGLRGTQTPAAQPAAAPEPVAPTEPATPLGGLAATLTGASPTKAITDRISKENKDGFITKVDAAYAAGDITKNQSDALKEVGSTDARGMAKAKDELMRLRERAAEKRTQEEQAGRMWDDPDYNWQEGDPKWADLSPALKEKWTAAAQPSVNKTSQALYDEIIAEHKAVEAMPKADTEDDMQAITGLPDADVKAIDKNNRIFSTGRGSLEWLAKHGSTPFIREVAARLAPHIGNVPVRFNLDGAPQSVKDFVAKGADGVSTLARDGSVILYFKDNAAVNESDLLHELVHASTQRAIATGNNAELVSEMNVLVTAIQRSLRDIHTDTNDPSARHFSRVLNNPHELLAYAFSSPTMRTFLMGLTPTGERIDPDQADQAAYRAERQFGTDGIEPLNMWERLVDWLRQLIGLPKKYQPALDRLLSGMESAKIEYLLGSTSDNIFKRMDELLDRTLAEQANTTDEDVKRNWDGKGRARPDAQAIQRPEAVPAAKPLPTSVPIPDFDPSNRFATTLKDWTGGWRTKPAMLGWMTLRQLGDRFKSVPGVQQFTELSAALGAKAKALMTESHKVDQDWAQVPRDAMLEMQRVMLESTMDQIWPNKTFEQNEHLDDTPLLRQKHAALAKRWQALPESARSVYNKAQAKMRKDWEERGKLLNQRITDQYRAELHHALPGAKLDAAANANKGDRQQFFKGLNKGESKSLRSMFSDLDEHAERLSQMQGPYFPLMRFGEHAVVAKSNDLNQAAENFSDAQAALTALNADEDASDESLKKARDKVKAAKDELEGFKDSEKHYIVEFYESPSEARDRVQQLVEHFVAQGQPMQVYSERRAEHFAKMDSISPSFMKKLEDTLANSLPDKDANAIRQAVRDLYIQNMPERSALKSQLRRIGVKGVKDAEMRRSFAAASMRNAWHLSRLEFGPGMNNILNELRNGDTDEERIVGGEFAKRMNQTMQPEVSNLLMDRLSNLSYLTYLGLSPSFFVINAMQPWTISLPVMAGRFGMKRSTVELGKAFNEVAAAMKQSFLDQNTWRFELNLENFKVPNERAMLDTLFNKGIIDVTIEHDLGSLASGKEQTAFGTVMSAASLPAHHTEVVNRVMTALAAYRLASSDGLAERQSHEQATKYAEQVVADTHLDYTPENAPRFMRSASLGGLGRIVFQFKKYMQGMIFLMGKMSADALKGDREAAKGLAYLTGMQIATAGAAGLPFAAPIGMLAGAVGMMYPDDDRPEFYLLIYKGMKDAIGETAARALMKGIPAALGADISGRVGFGNILNPLAFVPPGKEGSDYVAAATLALAGPSMSMVANYAEAMVMGADDPMKALQRALPKFMADPLRAIDRANRGVTNRRGDTLISPDEFGPLGIAMRAVGFEATDVTDMYDTRGAFLEARGARDDVRKRLLRQATEARQNGDDTAVREKISDFNERHPDDRITGKTLTQAAKAQRITAQSLREGVAIRKNDRSLAEKLGIGQ